MRDAAARVCAICVRCCVLAGKWLLVLIVGMAVFALAAQALALVVAALALLVLALCLAALRRKAYVAST